MKLADWRIKKGYTLEEVGKMIEVNASSVYYYENGRIPRPSVMTRITKETKGRVTSKDFY